MARPRSQKRIEKNERIREELFRAALKVVGDLGYAKASISKIAEIAGVSTGTFYLHFSSKQELYDQLLPWSNVKLTEVVPLHLRPGERYIDFEERNIRGFFDHISKDRGFARVMLEAEVAAPKAWADYIAVREADYIAVLETAWDRGEFPAFRRDEMALISSLLIGLRKALVWRHGHEAKTPRKAIETYLRLARGALLQTA